MRRNLNPIPPFARIWAENNLAAAGEVSDADILLVGNWLRALVVAKPAVGKNPDLLNRISWDQVMAAQRKWPDIFDAAAVFEATVKPPAAKPSTYAPLAHLPESLVDHKDCPPVSLGGYAPLAYLPESVDSRDWPSVSLGGVPLAHLPESLETDLRTGPSP